METKLDPTTKRWLIIGVSGIVVICLLFIIFKIFIFRPPKIEKETPSPKEIATLSPEEVAIQFLLASQEGGSDWKNFLFSDLSKVEFFEDSYFLTPLPIETLKPKNGAPPEFKIVSLEIEDEKAKVTIEENTNRKYNDSFFGFILPKKITFEFELIKVDNNWKIIKMTSSDLVSKSKMGEEIQLDELSIKIVKFEEGMPSELKLSPSEPFTKFALLEVIYKNQSKEEIQIDPVNEWMIFSKDIQISPFIFVKDGKMYSEKITLISGEKAIIYLVFEPLEKFVLEKVVFKNPTKKIIFSQ